MNKSLISIKAITLSAMFVAIGVVLSFFRIPLSTFTEITLTGLPLAAGACMLGPWIGFIIGALIDIVGYILAPKGAFFPGFTISSGLMGVIYGLLLYRNWWDKREGKNSILRNKSKGLAIRIVIAHFVKTLAISLCLNCFWLSVFYGMPFKAVFATSLPKELINFPIECFLIYLLLCPINGYQSFMRKQRDIE